MATATTEKAPTTEVEEEEFNPTVVYMSDGNPMFIGDEDDIIPWARKQGWTEFYVLGATEERKVQVETETGGLGTKTIPSEVEVFKVVSNDLGYIVTPLKDNKSLKLKEFQALAWFEMPKIPWKMVRTMEAFFREVEDTLHTESIVVLTYNPKVGGSDGWGFVVPEQTNSGAHCDYKPYTAQELKDDDAIIVGTAHSHPGMPAYASPTDHKDQENSPGIHITMGWKLGSKLTDYYIELQIDEKHYPFEPHQIFDLALPMPEVPEMEEWMKRVSKEQLFPKASTGYNGSYPGSGGYHGNGSTWQSQGSVTKSTYQDPAKYFDQNGLEYNLPEGCPDPKEVTVVARLLDSKEERCPVCQNFFRNEALDRRRCWECFCFLLIGPDETLDNVVEMRASKTDQPVFEIFPPKATRPIVIWDRRVTAEGKVDASQIRVFEGKA